MIRIAGLATPIGIDHKIQIYGMRVYSWKEIDVMVPNHDFAHYVPCTLLDGVFYWLIWLANDFSTNVRVIDALNTVERSFKQISLPGGVASELQTHLFLLNGSLALVVSRYDKREVTRFDIWLMDKYGINECWTD